MLLYTKYLMRDGNEVKSEVPVADGANEERHVFQDKDAEIIHQGLMLLVEAIRDLQAIVERVERRMPSPLDA